jgi:hypothetical protein
MKLGMLIPSRGRPQNITRLWQAMQETCTADTDLIVGLDTDDPTWSRYPVGPTYYLEEGISYVTPWVNELARRTQGTYTAIGHFGDDNVPVTKGWDTRVLEALDETPFAFADDQYPRDPGSLSCHIFMRSEVADTLGYMGPPEISHMYVDVAWMAWCVSCGYKYLSDVLIPHHHYTLGAAHDETYARSYAQTAVNLQAWHAYSRREGPGGLNADIAKLGGKPFTPDQLERFDRDLNIPEVWNR